ncbi:hypothetical protein [Halostagnicola sp. A-GB9-2]|uniref:hypothetical protein n=1 Tax=Halostagnicola sp. A-GB9-2 TaxID=3048066 RepID=UPI0024C03424|nr:hypothetical protein [Halostagnicola sp. A-GB9-2]MDJ1433088.1 hypothetical protein [Halostagnicola sp. A-GB9-2]
MANRRNILLTGGTVLAGVAGTFMLLNRDENIEHVLLVQNNRDTEYEVMVEGELNDEPFTFGPETVKGGQTWTVDRIDQGGTLSASFTVDGGEVWQTTHEIPTPEGDRRSFAHLILEPDGEVFHTVKQED